MEFKTAACPVIGIMRFLEIQRGKGGMKSKRFNQEVGATAGCTLRLVLEGIPIESDQSHGIRADAWFGSIRTASENSRHGHEGMFQDKQYHSLFPKAFIEEALKEAPGGVHSILEGKTQCEVPFIAVGYQYSRKTILHFILTKKAGSLKEGKPYEMKYTDSYGNVCTHYIECPDAISKIFATSKFIDTHNQLH